MAAVGAEVTGSYFLSSGVVSFFLLLFLLSIFLTALCSECSRRSFELRDSEDRNPPALIRVVKLEEAMLARENPMIRQIQNDEKEIHAAKGNTVSFSPRTSHLGAPQTNPDVQTNGSAAVMKTGGVNGSTPPDSDRIYHSINEGRIADESSPPPTNQEPGEEPGEEHGPRSDLDSNSVYAQISKKARPTTHPADTPKEVQVEVAVEEESLPPLPDRKSQLEG